MALHSVDYLCWKTVKTEPWTKWVLDPLFLFVFLVHTYSHTTATNHIYMHIHSTHNFSQLIHVYHRYPGHDAWQATSNQSSQTGKDINKSHTSAQISHFLSAKRQPLMDRVNVASYSWCVCVGVSDDLSSSYRLLGSSCRTLKPPDILAQTVLACHWLPQTDIVWP